MHILAGDLIFFYQISSLPCFCSRGFVNFLNPHCCSVQIRPWVRAVRAYVPCLSTPIANSFLAQILDGPIFRLWGRLIPLSIGRWPVTRSFVLPRTVPLVGTSPWSLASTLYWVKYPVQLIRRQRTSLLCSHLGLRLRRSHRAVLCQLTIILPHLFYVGHHFYELP
jgi:hypothetical protein